MTGRIFAAPEAEKIGVITAIAEDPHAAAHELAVAIAGKSPHAVRAAKSLLNKGLDEPLADALQLEARLQSDLLGRPNQIEAVMANRDDREPRFQDVVEMEETR
jgi:enoyl-CoA hydratase/carnithine racemase